MKRVLLILISLLLVGCTQEAEEVVEEPVEEPSLLDRCIASNLKNMEVNLLDKWILYNEDQKSYSDIGGQFINGEITYEEYEGFIQGTFRGFVNSLTMDEKNVYRKLQLWESESSLLGPYYGEEYKEVIDKIMTLEADYNKPLPDQAVRICNRQGIY